MAKKKRSVVKCDGRFHELREFLYKEAIPTVLGDSTMVTRKSLEDLWELVSGDVNSHDARDPYYDSTTDNLRNAPEHGPMSLVPLFESPSYTFASTSGVPLVTAYAHSLGNNKPLAEKLGELANLPNNFFKDVLRREPKDVVFPNGKNLAGYHIASAFGVGTIMPGGVGGGGIRADAPFLLGVYEQQVRGELNLASVVGFWAQDNNMIVSQMQPSGNGHLPSDVPFGVGSLHLAETVANLMGFKKIQVYSARGHPIFKEHPEDWNQYGKDFVMLYDNSSKKLGFNGGRHDGHHEKSLRH